MFYVKSIMITFAVHIFIIFLLIIKLILLWIYLKNYLLTGAH
jgi:hypothetical protein